MKHIIEQLEREQDLCGKKIKEMKVLVFILFFVLSCKINAQDGRSSYCECETKGTKILDDLKEQKVSMSSSYFEGSISVKISNNTKDTIFIFKSYFDKDISSSPYIYRYNKRCNKVNISFAPLLPYLFTKYSDRIIFKNRIIEDYQTVYDFYKIPPFYEYSFDIYTINFKENKEFIKDFDVSELNKFEKIRRFKRIKLKKNNPSFFVSIAYYNNIGILCNPNSYYLEELKFNDAAKNFKLLHSFLLPHK